MLGRMGWSVWMAAFAAAALAAAAPLPAAGAPPSPCTGSMLAGSFKVVPGSPGAGNIVYRLRLRDTSSKACFVTGVPGLTLLDSTGRALPTRETFTGKAGSQASVIAPLGGKRVATLTARFSPDIPGPGEAVSGPCEKTAYKLRVKPSGGGSVVVPIEPPTAVCEHGRMQVSVLAST
jgi:Protein of unknown function (DUF4232)